MQLPKKVIGIILTEKTVASFLIQVSVGEIEALSFSKPVVFSSDDLLLKTDESLQNLGDQSEDVDEVIFVFDHHWHDGTDVFADRKKEIETLKKELSLKSLGFITLENTVAEFLTQENHDFSALVAIVSEADLDVNVFRQGKQICHETVGRSSDFRGDMIEALARLVQACGKTKAYLPHKFILLSLELGELKMNELSQLLLETDWLARKMFLQMPTTEVIETRKLLSQITETAGAVIRKHFLGESMKPEPVSEPVPAPVTQPPQPTPRPSPMNTAATFGLPVTDSVQKQIEAQLSTTGRLVNGQVDEPEAVPQLQAKSTKVAVAFSTPHKTMGQLQILAKRFFAWFSHHWHSRDDKPKKPFILTGLVLGLFTWLFFGWWYLTNQALVTISITPASQALSQELKVSLSDKITSLDQTKLILPAQVVNKKITVEDTTQASGDKDVGDHAQGQVRLTNKTMSAKTFKKGTKLVTNDPHGFVFSLLDDVTVPAATVSTDATDSQETKTFGVKPATIQANFPGESGNIPKDTNFKIGSFSTHDYTAVSLADFSGGTSKTVAVVAQADLDRLTKRLTDEVKSKVKTDLAQEKSAQRLYSPPISLRVIKQVFSHKVGEETDEVKLTLTAQVKVLSFAKDDLLTLVRAALTNHLTAGMKLIETDKGIEMLTKFADKSTKSKRQSATPVLLVNVTAKAQPVLDPDQIKQKIKGRYLNEARSILLEDKQIQSVTISFSPASMARFIKKVPADTSKLKIVIH